MLYSEMRPDEYRQALEAAPIAYLPWGAHEWHGMQNPLGLDSLKAEAMCVALQERTGGVVFPAVYCGHATMKPGLGFGCTLEFAESLVRELARQYLAQLADEGFRVIVVLMGHYGREHVEAIKRVVEDFNLAHQGTRAWAFADHEATSEEGFVGEHAALFETSYVMAARPELVDMSALHEGGQLDPASDGIIGQDPRGAASAEVGRRGLEALVANAAPEVLSLLASVLGEAAKAVETPAPDEAVVTVYEAADEMEAQIVRGLLAAAGVSVMVSPSISQVYPFPISPLSDESVAVPESEAERARELIRQFLEDGRELDPETSSG